jgi:hypothetical protein
MCRDPIMQGLQLFLRRGLCPPDAAQVRSPPMPRLRQRTGEAWCSARITETATRVRIAFAAACPEADLFSSLVRSLLPAGP